MNFVNVKEDRISLRLARWDQIEAPRSEALSVVLRQTSDMYEDGIRILRPPYTRILMGRGPENSDAVLVPNSYNLLQHDRLLIFPMGSTVEYSYLQSLVSELLTYFPVFAHLLESWNLSLQCYNGLNDYPPVENPIHQR